MGRSCRINGSFRAELPFPTTEFIAEAGFLIGSNRPKSDYRSKAMRGGDTLKIGRSGTIPHWVFGKRI